MIMYNKKSYLKIKSDPEKWERLKLRNRERMRRKLKDPEFIRKNRLKSKQFYHKNKQKQEFILKNQIRFKKMRLDKKITVIKYYSDDTMMCACCGEIILEFLEVDHINNDGNKHRREIGNQKIYDWLIKNKFPTGFQILCANCNKGKSLNDGICPHV